MKKIILFARRYIYSIISCLYLFTIGIFFPKYRGILYNIWKLFYEVRKTKNYISPSKSIIPKVVLSKIVPEDIFIQIREPILTDGNISVIETIVIAKAIKVYNPTNLFEIGTFDGRTTLNMAANCSDDARVYTLDLPRDKLYSTGLPLGPGDKEHIDKEVCGSRYLGKDVEKKIIQLYGDSATFDFSQFYNSIDFVFIDGSHSYGYILNDSRLALKLLRNRHGLIFWHDYDDAVWWKDVTKALNELYSTDSKFKGLRHVEGTTLVCLISI